MKKILSIAALSMLSLSSLLTAPAQAALSTATGNFNVSLTLTPKCEINSPTALSMVYTSFQTTASSGTSTINVKCTNKLAYSLTLDNAAVTDTDTNLDYTLSLSKTSGIGTGADDAITVTGGMISGQSGTCNSTTTCNNSLSANKQRTLTVSY